jgi:hypothetical protein
MSDDELQAFLAVGRLGEQLLAAEILALRAKQLQLLKQLAAAEEALRPFAKLAARIPPSCRDDSVDSYTPCCTNGDFRRAAAALRALEGKDG